MIFFGNEKKLNEKRIEKMIFLSRGFAYKGFQCQRCDCVVHKDCCNHRVHPCTGKKYQDVNR